MLIVDNRKITVALYNYFDLPTADVNALDTDTDTDSDSDVKVEPNPAVYHTEFYARTRPLAIRMNPQRST